MVQADDLLNLSCNSDVASIPSKIFELFSAGVRAQYRPRLGTRWILCWNIWRLLHHRLRIRWLTNG